MANEIAISSGSPEQAGKHTPMMQQYQGVNFFSFGPRIEI
jgi:hypothetical protein